MRAALLLVAAMAVATEAHLCLLNPIQRGGVSGSDKPVCVGALTCVPKRCACGALSDSWSAAHTLIRAGCERLPCGLGTMRQRPERPCDLLSPRHHAGCHLPEERAFSAALAPPRAAARQRHAQVNHWNPSAPGNFSVFGINPGECARMRRMCVWVCAQIARWPRSLCQPSACPIFLAPLPMPTRPT